MFIETSSPRQHQDKAQLESEEFQPTGSSGRCLKFWYHMFGNTIGSLNIWMSSNGTSGQIWSLSGDQNNQWRFGQAPISSKGVYQVSNVIKLFIMLFLSSQTLSVKCSQNQFNYGN